MALAPLTLASSTAAGRSYCRDNTYKKLAYIGPFNDGTGLDDHVKTYNLTPGKEYSLRNEWGAVWVVMDHQGSDISERPIDMSVVNLYFKPLSQLRDDKLNEILA